MGRGGVNNYQKLRDVIYGRPLYTSLSGSFLKTAYENEKGSLV